MRLFFISNSAVFVVVAQKYCLSLSVGYSNYTTEFCNTFLLYPIINY